MPPNVRTQVQNNLLLDGEFLQKLPRLIVHKIDVTRLRDDRSEILSGEEIMFVATAKFRLPATEAIAISGIDDASRGNLVRHNVQAGDDIFSINSDGDITSPLEMVEQDVDDWVAENFAFQFTVNNSLLPASELTPGDPPWILRLDTSRYSDSEYVEVDVVITRKAPPVVLPPEPASVPRLEHLVLRSDDGQMSLRVHLDTADLPTGKTSFTLVSDGKKGSPPARLPIVVTFTRHEPQACKE